MVSKHLTLRIGEDALARLDEESERTGKNPGIVFRDGATGRRAALANGPQIWTLINVYNDFASAGPEPSEKTAEWLSITAWQLEAGLRYYAEFPAEIDDRIARNEREAERGYAEWLRQQDRASA
jgi:hypothetical protein